MSSHSTKQKGKKKPQKRIVIKREAEKIKLDIPSTRGYESSRIDKSVANEGGISHEEKTLDEKLIEEFKQCLTERSKMNCLCCNTTLVLENMADHVLNNKRCKQIKRYQFISRENVAKTLRQIWVGFADQNEIGEKVKCEFCSTSLLK